MVYIHCFDCFCILTGSRIHSRSSVNEIRGYCPAGCGQNMLSISAYRGCHILVYGWLSLSTIHCTEDARPIIIDAPSTLILMMGQGVFRTSFLIHRRPILCSWQGISCRSPDYPKYTGNNRWRSVNAHLQHAAGLLFLFILITRAANT